jgi:hypothetical protein
LLLAGATLLTFGLESRASGALLLSNTQYSLRYDGHVKNAAGTAFGVEGHAHPSITFNQNESDLPVTTNPAPPLNAAKLLTVSETEVVAPMGKTRAIIDIHGKSTPSVFTNVMDPNFLVEFEAFFVSNDVTQGLSIDVNDPNAILVENFGVFHQLPQPPNVVQVSGLGTAVSPLRVFLGISPTLLATDNGRVKVHFLYSPVNVPEPSALAVLLGIAGLVPVVGGRRR